MKESGCDIVRTCAALEKKIFKKMRQDARLKNIYVIHIQYVIFTSIYVFNKMYTLSTLIFAREIKIAVQKINFRRRKKRLPSDFEFNELLTHLT